MNLGSRTNKHPQEYITNDAKYITNDINHQWVILTVGNTTCCKNIQSVSYIQSVTLTQSHSQIVLTKKRKKKKKKKSHSHYHFLFHYHYKCLLHSTVLTTHNHSTTTILLTVNEVSLISLLTITFSDSSD